MTKAGVWLFGLLVAALGPAVLAQGAAAVPPSEVREIRFAAGATRATVSDSVERGARHTYAFDARKGQWTDIRVTAMESNAAITVWQPGAVLPGHRDEDIRGSTLKGAGEGADASRWQGYLPQSGRYLILVGPTRGGASYTLELTIGARSPGRGVPASAPALPPK